MKSVVCLFLLLISNVAAAPFLVCDPYPSGLPTLLQPASFIVRGLGATPVSVPALVNADGTLQLHYDLASVGNGSFTVVVAAVNSTGGVSPDSLPFTFAAGIPASPTNLRIAP